jgi:hypothetical protein
MEADRVATDQEVPHALLGEHRQEIPAVGGEIHGILR